MRRRHHALIGIVAAVLAVTPAVAGATDAPVESHAGGSVQAASPRMIGGHAAAPLRVLATAGAGEDLVYLGRRGERQVALHWIDAVSGQDARLAAVPTGDFDYDLEALGDIVVFTGRSMRDGVEPWVSHGAAASTRLLRDIAPGRTPDACVASAACGKHPADSGPGPFVTIGDTAYFSAADPKHGRELWRTDGTRSGTRLVADMAPGRKSSLDGRSLASVDGVLYLVADDGRHGAQLWRSDGTRAGTRMVTDLGPGGSVSWWDAPVAAGDQVYFTAQDVEAGLELWRSDGTVEGTVMVRDVRPGPKASKPEDLLAVGDQVYFTANDGAHGRELWRTDGSADGTVLVKDIEPGRADSHLGDLAALGDTLYFAVWGQPGLEYRSDGTEAGTTPIGGASARPQLTRRPAASSSSMSAGGRLYFAADDGVHGTELWSTDGTPEGTGLVYDIWPGSEGSGPAWLVAAKGYLYFTADDGEHGRQLWQLPLADV